MSGLTDGGDKVTMNTSRAVDETSFNAMWNDDNDTSGAPTDTTPPITEAASSPAVESRTGEEPAPDGGANTAATPAPAAGAAPEVITREDGATWSEKSQRWHKDGKIVAGEPPLSAAPKVEPAPPAPTSPVPVAAAPKVEAPKAEPFFVRVNGKRVDVPGLEAVALEHREAVRGLIVDGLNHRQNFSRMQAESKQRLAQAEDAGNKKADKYNRASVYLLGQVEQLLAGNPQALSMVKREVGLMLREADLSIPKAPEAPKQDEGQVDERAARATLARYVGELFEDVPDAGKYFTPEDRKDYEAHVQDLIESFFGPHPDDGSIALAEHKVEAHFKRELSKLQRAHQARETAARDAEKLKAAASFNAATQTTPTPPTPHRPKPAPVAASSGPARRSWDQAVRDAWADDDED